MWGVLFAVISPRQTCLLLSRHMALFNPASRPELLRALLPLLAPGTATQAGCRHLCACLTQHQLLVEALPDCHPALDALLGRVLHLTDAHDQARMLLLYIR